MTKTAVSSRSLGVLRYVALGVGFTFIVILLLLWLAGAFHKKIGAGRGAEQASRVGRLVKADKLVPARLISMPVTEPAVGTIRAVYQASVASKLLAKVTAVNVQAGQMVKGGEVLVQLDDADLKAKLRQAEAAVSAAETALAQARVEFERVDGLYKQGNETRLEWERTETALKTRTAELEEARQEQRQAETMLSYATITSPIDGKVIDKEIEVGDTASPGQTLVTLFDPTRMQLVARVRESLTHRLAVGQDIGVHIDAIGKTCAGRISEIVPEAESASRTFSVKVTGPCPTGVYSGMFGRLLIPLDEQQVLVIPRAAVSRVGQLDLVEVALGDRPSTERKVVLEGRPVERRAVQLGRTYGDEVEVLSGLQAGEMVALQGSAQ
jgi:RND family efflux transporter MFP subunit